MAAAEGMFNGVCGSLYGCDTEVDRHPYHRNCQCALHRPRASAKGAHTCPRGLPRAKTVSYPIRKSWSEGCLAMAASSSAQSSPASSPAASPAAVGNGPTGRHRRLSSVDEVAEEEEGCGVFFKV